MDHSDIISKVSDLSAKKTGCTCWGIITVILISTALLGAYAYFERQEARPENKPSASASESSGPPPYTEERGYGIKDGKYCFRDSTKNNELTCVAAPKY